MKPDRRTGTSETADREWSGFEIAVVGMAGRFPGARDIDELWANLRQGVESIRFFDRSELAEAGVEPELLDDPNYVPAAGVLEGIERFDAAFFGIPPREAALMDPQHRLFLEEAYHALEHAGHAAGSFGGRIGVYGGASASSYLTRNLLSSGDRDVRHGLSTTFGTQADFLTTRVSYKLGLEGPSLDVQTSCSTSLVAVHLACQALLVGECDLALAGGVCIDLPVKHGYLYQEEGIYSPDGHCRAFDAGAQGTVGGNGVAVVVLRRLGDAVEAGDTIHGVIRGSAINNDGSDKVGYAAPSIGGQAAAIRGALAAASVSAESISYIEAHGTGTGLGDQVEIAALTRAFREHTSRIGFCRIGSIKSNIGHLDTAAGVTGLIKVCLALKNRLLPASLHVEEPNPRIGFAETPFVVNDRALPWEAPQPLRAGVSSFGIGGTNAHLIVEEAPVRVAAAAPRRRHQLLITSAKSEAALQRLSERLAHHLEECGPAAGDQGLADVAFTLQVGRAELPYRRFAVAIDAGQAVCQLDTPAAAPPVVDADRPVAFLFPGQGVQYVDMGRGLYEEQVEFRDAVDLCAEILEPRLGLDLRSILYPEASGRTAAERRLRETAMAQPAIFVVDYALARLAMSDGVTPVAMAGHSLGEFVAACLAEVMSLEEALGLVAERGRLMQSAATGSMLAVAASLDEIETMLPEGVSVAAINEASQVVVSGPTPTIERLRQQLDGRGTRCHPLETSHAFHSEMMDEVVEPFVAVVERCELRAPRRPYLSSLSGTWITSEEATDPAYYGRHLRQPVRFRRVLAELCDDPRRVLLEVGPGRVLSAMATRAGRDRGRGDGEPAPVAIASMRGGGESREDGAIWMEALGSLWQAGGRVEWKALWRDERRRRMALPLYPFAGERHWIEPQEVDPPLRSGRKRLEVGRWFYTESFRRVAIAAPGKISLQGPLLLFADRGLAPELVARLTAEGIEVLSVRPSERASQQGDAEWTIRPGVSADYEWLMGEVVERFGTPRQVVHLWSLESPDPEIRAESGLENGFLSLAFLAQALERAGVSRARILAVTRGVHAVSGSEPLSPEQAPILGAVLGISQELPGLAVRAVDLEPATEGPQAVGHVVLELAGAATERFVAYRGAHRWVRDAEPLTVEAPADRPRLLAEGAHYLIVGGTGSVGLEIARFLAEEAQARLTLVGRRELEVRRREAEASGDVESLEIVVRAMDELRRIEALGSDVGTVAAEATDRDAMRRAIERAEELRGPIRGVVFAAGEVKRMQPLTTLDREEALAQLDPKLKGLIALDAVLGERELDFCLVQSSLAARLGALALVPYVAAHAFVDAYVAWHNAAGRSPWSVVDWDNWLTWKEPEILLSEGEAAFFMRPEEARRALRRVFDLPAGSRLLVSTGDLRHRMDRWAASEVAEASGREPAAALGQTPGGTGRSEEPRSAEEAVAKAFREVLGLDEVEASDSFFELGGDSVLGLQVVSRLATAGWRVSPADLFDHPTPLALAAVAATGAASERGDWPPRGEVPPTPIQCWFFEQELPEPHHFNLPVVLALPWVPAVEDLRRGLEAVVAHHDAFRLRFDLEGDALGQRYRDADDDRDSGAPDIVLEHLTSGDPSAAERRSEELQASLDPGRGPLAAALLVESDEEGSARLVWTAHHLVVDVVSWRILAEDLGTALEQLRRGESVALPSRTTSFATWAKTLREYARSATVRSQAAYWSKVVSAEVSPLPTDREEGTNDVGSLRTVETTLEGEVARDLLAGAPALDLRVEELLLAALAEALAAWSGSNRVRIDLEGHGREPISPRLDLSRTVGWFTNIYPVLLELPETDEPQARLRGVRRQLRRVPGRGLGYGALRYLSDDAGTRARLAAAGDAEVGFVYLGRFGANAGEGLGLLPLAAGTGAPAASSTPRRHLLDVVALAEGETLRIEIGYSRNRHSSASLERLADDLRSRLEGIAQLAQGATCEKATSADFPATRLKAEELDRLMARIGGSTDPSAK